MPPQGGTGSVGSVLHRRADGEVREGRVHRLLRTPGPVMAAEEGGEEDAGEGDRGHPGHAGAEDLLPVVPDGDLLVRPVHQLLDAVPRAVRGEAPLAQAEVLAEAAAGRRVEVQLTLAARRAPHVPGG